MRVCGMWFTKKPDFNRLTCGFCSFQRVTAFLSNNRINVDQVLSERIESPKDHGGHSPIHKYLIKKVHGQIFQSRQVKV